MPMVFYGHGCDLKSVGGRDVASCYYLDNLLNLYYYGVRGLFEQYKSVFKLGKRIWVGVVGALNLK